MKRPKVVLADAQTLVAAGLSKLLESECEVVATVHDADALVRAATRFRPEIVLLDASTLGRAGLDAAREIRRIAPGTKIIFLTAQANYAYAKEAFRAGCAGFLFKNSAASELSAAVRAVLAGRTYITPLAEVRPALHGREQAEPLTQRQQEVLRLVAAGCSTKEVAATLGISTKTVEFHKAGIAARLGIRTTAELTKYALQHGLMNF
jgi:DNA-binding NarL/FixJ family response regulator